MRYTSRFQSGKETKGMFFVILIAILSILQSLQDLVDISGISS